MAIIGHGGSGILNSPLLWAMMGLNAAKGGAELYRDYEDRNRQSFVEEAAIEGQPVEHIQGGPFRRLLSGATGGLVSPNIAASPEDMRQEVLGLREQQLTDLKTASMMTGMRTALGPAPFQEGGPFAEAGKRYGLNVLATPAEQNQALQRQIAEQKNALEVNAQELKILDLQERGKERKLTDYYHTPGYLGMAATTRGYGEAAGKNKAYLDSTLINNKDVTFFDPSNYGNMSAKYPKMTVGEAESKGYVQVKDPQVIRDINQSVAMLNNLGKIEKLIPKVFPLGGSSVGLLGKGISNRLDSKTNPDIAQMYASIEDLVGYIRAVQGRYPSMSEINLGEEFWPQPGGTREGWFKTSRSDTQAVAFAKLDSVRTHIKNILQAATSGGGIDSSSGDIDTDIHGEITGIPGGR